MKNKNSNDIFDVIEKFANSRYDSLCKEADITSSRKDSLLKHYKNQLAKYQKKLDELNDHHDSLGGPMNLTYHGGWDKGYLEGKISILEAIIDDLDGPSI